MRKPAIVENFYARPDDVQHLALAQEYTCALGRGYPGFESEKALYAPAIIDRLQEVVGGRVRPDARYAFGTFRKITGQSRMATHVHADRGTGWAAMVYLSPDWDPAATTAFLRHRETGAYGPVGDLEAIARGFSCGANMEEEVFERDSRDLSKWDEWSAVEPIYNRLVVFEGARLFHAPMPGAPRQSKAPRLTHNFFFDVVD